MRGHRSPLLIGLAALAVLVPVATACGGDEDAAPSDTVAATPIDTGAIAPFSVITADQGVALMDADPSIVLIDVRTPEEFGQGHIEGADNIDVESGAFAAAIADLPTDGRYVVYCRSGNRSATAVDMMEAAGFTDVYDMGGIQAWMAAGHPIVT
jgi:rhodanese-related sulfurtransferase